MAAKIGRARRVEEARVMAASEAKREGLSSSPLSSSAGSGKKGGGISYSSQMSARRDVFFLFTKYDKYEHLAAN